MQTYFLNNANLNEVDKRAIENIVSFTTLKKGEFWIEEGKLNNKIAQVTKGYLRRYYLDDGKEITDHFYFEGDYSTDISSIITKESPKCYVVAMEDTELAMVDFYAFERLRQNSIGLQTSYSKYLEKTYVQFYKRIASFVTQSPKERYYELMRTYPQAIQRIPQYLIASYLGISPQHLSRLRNQKS